MWGIAIKVLSLFTGGGLQGAVAAVTDVYKAKIAAGDDATKIAADLAAKQLQLDAQDAALQTKLTNDERWYTPRGLIGYSVAFYLGKILVWDKSLHLGVTDGLDERMQWVLTTVVIAYFGARAVRDLTTYFRR